MTQNNSAVSTQAATQTQTEQTQQTQTPKGFVIDSRTRGEVKGLGLVAVRSAQDGDGNVEVEELVGEHERGRKTMVPAETVKMVSNKPGSAKASSEYGHLAEDDQESLLNLARRLAGDPPRQTRTTNQSQQGGNPWLGAVTGKDNTALRVEQERNGNLYAYGAVYSRNPLGVTPLTVELRPLKSWTEPVLDNDGRPTGEFVTVSRFVLAVK